LFNQQRAIIFDLVSGPQEATTLTETLEARAAGHLPGTLLALPQTT